MSESSQNEVNLNPYAPGIVQKKELLSDVEQVRKQYLSHEASVKSIGILFFIGGLYSWAFVASLFGMPSSMQTPVHYLACGGVAIYGLALLVTAFGVRKLKAWSRFPAAILAGFGLFSVPLGMIVNTYILFLLLSKKSNMVFSTAYKEVIEQTPHMKYRTSATVLLIVGLLLAVVVAAVFVFVVRRP